MSESSDRLDRINEERFEQDLPPVTHQQLMQEAADEMWDTYGYDIGK